MRMKYQINVIKDYNCENFKYAIFYKIYIIINLIFKIKMNLMEMSGQDHEYVKKSLKNFLPLDL